VLGRGACGSVMSIRHRKTKESYAMKVINLNTVDSNLEALLSELEIQRTLDHPNICKIFESYVDEAAGEMAIVMEICTGGSMVSRMRQHKLGYGERAAATLVEKMLSAVLYCHHHGVVHRDIKLDNFIYENEAEDAELKLIDFGFAAELTHSKKDAMNEQLGTPSYMAPELWSTTGEEYDSSVDMWAVGVVTYMMLSGQRPFHHQDPKVKADMIRRSPLEFPSPTWDKVSAEAKDFCSCLMQKRPRDRLSATAATEHPWIKNASRLRGGVDAAHELANHEEVVRSLEAFCEADDLKKIALEVIAFSMPPAKLKSLRDMFVKIDTDNSGTISIDEFRSAMALGDLPEDKIERMYTKMDIDGSGEVDYSEFLSAALSAQSALVSNAGNLMAAFNTLDSDGDGYITQADLDKALDGQVDEKALADMLSPDHGIADAQGRVNFQAFKSMMLRGLRNSISQASPNDEKVVKALRKSIRRMSAHPGLSGFDGDHDA